MGQQVTGDYATSETPGLKQRIDMEQESKKASEAAATEQRQQAEASAAAAAEEQRAAPISPPSAD
eukprot:4274981-Pyramimonas_sp.AAC.1